MRGLEHGLRELSQREAPPERLDAVRARVLARIEWRRRMLPVVWLAGSAATAALALLLWRPAVPPTEPLRLTWRPPAPPVFAWSIPERKAAPVATAVESEEEIRVVDWTESTEERPGAALLQMPSTDPNVLIYFIVQGKGD